MDATANKRVQLSQQLLDFINRCPTAYHTIAALKEILKQNGFEELSEQEHWTLTSGGKYFVTRNGSSLLSFTLPSANSSWQGLRVIAAHCDSPAFKLKDTFDASASGYCRLNVEKYGGMICSSWMDRPLSVAGRVLLSDAKGVSCQLVDQKRPCALIPSVAIHMDRSVNDGKKYNPQVDMLPIVGIRGNTEKQPLSEMLALGGELLSHDLYLYACERGFIWGDEDEMITAPRLDDLMCVYGGLLAYLEASAQSKNHVNMLAVFDNEEIGSQTLQGAASSFLEDTIERIFYFHGNENNSSDTTYTQLAQSWMLSADNAHALHPNHPEYADARNRPSIGGGVVLKFNAQQKYATDAIGAAMFRKICALADVKVQSFANRSDMPGGSTLGNIAQTRIPIRTVDIGVPQLAMHSAMETAGTADFLEYIRACTAFYRANIRQGTEDALTIEV